MILSLGRGILILKQFYNSMSSGSSNYQVILYQVISLTMIFIRFFSCWAHSLFWCRSTSRLFDRPRGTHLRQPPPVQHQSPPDPVQLAHPSGDLQMWKDSRLLLEIEGGTPSTGMKGSHLAFWEIIWSQSARVALKKGMLFVREAVHLSVIARGRIIPST